MCQRKSRIMFIKPLTVVIPEKEGREIKMQKVIENVAFLHYLNI